eukprot:4373227-Prymnesium_polylepis.1
MRVVKPAILAPKSNARLLLPTRAGSAMGELTRARFHLARCIPRAGRKGGERCVVPRRCDLLARVVNLAVPHVVVHNRPMPRKPARGAGAKRQRAAVVELCGDEEGKASRRVAGLIAREGAVGVDVEVAVLGVSDESPDGVGCSGPEQRRHVEADEKDLLVVHGLARVHDVVAHDVAVDMELECAEAAGISACAHDRSARGDGPVSSQLRGAANPDGVLPVRRSVKCARR